MILGMSIPTFTFVHVVLSLVGMASGLAVMLRMVKYLELGSWNPIFLCTIVLTSVTGFMSPAKAVSPGQVVGALSLVVLAIALFALYGRRLAGSWRWIYAVAVVVALYLDVMVGVVQAFTKLPFLDLLAPTRSEPPFLVAQAAVLVSFLIIGFFAQKRFQRPWRLSGHDELGAGE